MTPGVAGCLWPPGCHMPSAYGGWGCHSHSFLLKPSNPKAAILALYQMSAVRNLFTGIVFQNYLHIKKIPVPKFYSYSIFTKCHLWLMIDIYHCFLSGCCLTNSQDHTANSALSLTAYSLFLCARNIFDLHNVCCQSVQVWPCYKTYMILVQLCVNIIYLFALPAYVSTKQYQTYMANHFSLTSRS